MILLKREKLLVPKKYVYLTAILFSAAVVLQISSTEQNATIQVYVRHIVLFTSIYLLWAVTIDFINGIIRPFKEETSRFLQILERFMSASILVISNLAITNLIYYAVLISFMDFTASEAYADFQPYILKSIIIRFFDIIVIGLILKIVAAYQTVQKQKLKVVSLENQLNVSQLEALRNQLDPHFLFNTLHTLNTLIGYDDKKAKSMVIKVTNLLRKMLEKREKQMISFQEELEYFTNYLEIEEERFYDRLEVKMEVEDDTRDILVPTLLLQPLIENAFKHGISKLENKGKIHLKAFVDKGHFVVELTNSIPIGNQNSTSTSTKIGLENLKNRLNQVYGEAHSFSAKKEKDIFKVSIAIHKISTI